MIARRSFVFSLLALSLLASTGASAQAENSPTPGDGRFKAWCKEHPKECAAKREELRAKCQANPDKCEKARDRIRKHRSDGSE